MSDLLRVYRDPALTAAAWDALTTPERVPDLLVQRLPYRIVDRDVFELQEEDAKGSLARFAEKPDSLVRSRVLRQKNVSATIDGLFRIDSRWALVHGYYQPGVHIIGWALLHEANEDKWAGFEWPSSSTSTVTPPQATMLLARAAFDAAL